MEQHKEQLMCIRCVFNAFPMFYGPFKSSWEVCIYESVSHNYDVRCVQISLEQDGEKSSMSPLIIMTLYRE